jgi:NitT/TauT family transport system permease protein
MTVSSLTSVSRRRDPRMGRPSLADVRPVLAPVITAVVVLVAWAVSAAQADSSVYPGPLASVSGLWDQLREPEFRANVASSALSLAIAYAAVLTVGTVSGLGVGLSRFWAKVLLPLAHSFNGIPRIVFFPIFLLMLGSGGQSLVGFAFACGVIPMFLISAEAASSVSRLHLKLAASLELGYGTLLRKIVIPSVFPALVSGMKVTFGLTFVGLLLAELFASSSGIGSEILTSIAQVRMADIVGQVLLIGLMAVLPTVALRFAEARTTRRYAPPR